MRLFNDAEKGEKMKYTGEHVCKTITFLWSLASNDQRFWGAVIQDLNSLHRFAFEFETKSSLCSDIRFLIQIAVTRQIMARYNDK